MADEILNTGPGEEITPADPETVTGEPTKAAEPAARPLSLTRAGGSTEPLPAPNGTVNTRRGVYVTCELAHNE